VRIKGDSMSNNDVRVTYETGIETAHESPRVFFADNKGGFTYAGSPSFSHYIGSFIPFKTADGWNMFKVIHRFIPHITQGLHYKQHRFSLFYDTGKIKLYNCAGGFHLEFRGNIKIPIELDPREIYDFSDSNRFFTITQEKDCLLIWYKRSINQNALPYKLHSSEQDDQVYIAIKTESSVEFIKNWVKYDYSLEKKRDSSPLFSYVFHALNLVSTDYKKKQVAISWSFSREEALQNVQLIYESKEPPKSHICSIMPQLPFTVEESYMTSAIQAYYGLDKLSTTINNQFGLYAGLPWFFHWWSRDEAISLIALIICERADLAKEIVMRLINSINEKGLVQNRFPYSMLGSADATGWVCKRIHDLLNQNEHIFSASELATIYEKLQASFEIRKKSSQSINETQTLLQHSGPLETWMDTGAGYDEREGYCIEIQALWATQLSLLLRLSQKIGGSSKEYLHELRDFLEEVRLRFTTQSGLLCDRLLSNLTQDETVRPNVFLAYYIYPELCNDEVWKNSIRTGLDELWCDWGTDLAGIATISKKSPLFKERYTGESNLSYHRGDSWYFMNAISAIVLHEKGFTAESEKLLQALREQLISRGSIGCIAEVSDAKELTSDGCELQLWSCALYLESLYRLKRVK
jgi:glycogen debranching enzyme